MAEGKGSVLVRFIILVSIRVPDVGCELILNLEYVKGRERGGGIG